MVFARTLGRVALATLLFSTPAGAQILLDVHVVVPAVSDFGNGTLTGTLTVTGEAFGAVPPYVYLGTMPLTVLAASQTSLVVQVPDGTTPGSYQLTVIRKKGLPGLDIFEVALGTGGPAGPEGPPGAIGPPGAAGPAGVDGAAGPAGQIGPAGVNGPAGPVGPAGASGPAGPIGPAGPVGPAGAAGPAGAIGPMGNPGPAGLTGPVGAQGPVGPAGPGGAIDLARIYYVEASSSTTLACTSPADMAIAVHARCGAAIPDALFFTRALGNSGYAECRGMEAPNLNTITIPLSIQVVCVKP